MLYKFISLWAILVILMVVTGTLIFHEVYDGTFWLAVAGFGVFSLVVVGRDGEK